MTGFDFITPDWPAPKQVMALTTTRQTGESLAPYQHFNVALHVGDDELAVTRNRQQLCNHLEGLTAISWLDQVHSSDIVDACAAKLVTADANYSGQSGIACAVMTADCLPLLVCDRHGREVAAIHAGWRGLLGGVIENSLARFNASTDQLMVWLGPAISQPHFEVGDDVRRAFITASSIEQRPMVDAAFAPHPQNANKYFADLYALARLRLQAIGVSAIYGGEFCTYADTERFYSYRRDSQTGRMASLIYLKSPSY